MVIYTRPLSFCYYSSDPNNNAQIKWVILNGHPFYKLSADAALLITASAVSIKCSKRTSTTSSHLTTMRMAAKHSRVSSSIPMLRMVLVSRLRTNRTTRLHNSAVWKRVYGAMWARGNYTEYSFKAPTAPTGCDATAQTNDEQQLRRKSQLDYTAATTKQLRRSSAMTTSGAMNERARTNDDEIRDSKPQLWLMGTTRDVIMTKLTA